MRVIAIGKASRDSSESEIFVRYAARIKPALELLELPYGVGSPAEIKRREAASILAAIDDKEFLVALDGGGSTPDSPELANSSPNGLTRVKKSVLSSAVPKGWMQPSSNAPILKYHLAA